MTYKQMDRLYSYFMSLCGYDLSATLLVVQSMYMYLPTNKWCWLSWYPINSSMEELPVMLEVTLLIRTCVDILI